MKDIAIGFKVLFYHNAKALYNRHEPVFIDKVYTASYLLVFTRFGKKTGFCMWKTLLGEVYFK